MSTTLPFLAQVLAQNPGGAPQTSWSFTQFLTSTALGLLGLLLGGLIQRWLARGKPSLQVTSIGFAGSPEFIKVEDELITLSEKDSYGTTLRKYEPFSTLVSRHRSSAEQVERHREAIRLCEEWLEQSPAQGETTDPVMCLSIEALRKHPLALSETVCGALIGHCRRGDLTTPPVPRSVVARCQDVAILAETDDDIHVSMGSFGIIFPKKGVPNEKRKEDVRLLADSLAKGVSQNLRFYVHQFVTQAKASVLVLLELKEKLEQAMLPDARISVVASIYNTGRSAITLQPHLGLKILHQDFKTKAFILAHNPVPANRQATDVPAQEDQKPRGRHVIVQAFLPETSSTPYISIAPGQFYEAHLLATSPLGAENGKSLMQIYGTGLLSCQIVAVTASGDAVWSTPTAFSSAVTDMLRKNLEELVKGR